MALSIETSQETLSDAKIKLSSLSPTFSCPVVLREKGGLLL